MNLNEALRSRAVVRRQWQQLYDHCPGQAMVNEMMLFSYNGDLHRHRMLPLYFRDDAHAGASAALKSATLSHRLDSRVPWRHERSTAEKLPGPFLELLHRSYFLARYADAPLLAFRVDDGELAVANTAAITWFGRVVPISEQASIVHRAKHPEAFLAIIVRTERRLTRKSPTTTLPSNNGHNIGMHVHHDS